MKSGTDTGSMQKGAMSATGRVGRKKSGTERDGTERKRRPDTSPRAGLPFNETLSQGEARETGVTSGSRSKRCQ